MTIFTRPLIKRPAGSAPRPPLRSLLELADMLGTTVPSLSGLLSNSADAPKPVFTHRNRLGTASWYVLPEFRKWYNTVNKEIK